MKSVALPFDKTAFMEVFGGQEMVIGKNHLPSSQIDMAARVKFSDGKFEGGMSGLWEVEAGQLVLMDNWKKPVFRFYGLETKNGSVFMVGEPLMESHLAGFARAVLYPYQPLGSQYRICISSHVSYSEALTRLLRSLARVKFPRERVVVVVGGATSRKADEMDGWHFEYVPENADGFTAFLGVPQDVDSWWLLLHDTCEVADDFVAKIGDMDVGLNYDMILPAATPCEVGLYSSSFVKRVVDAGYLKKTPVSLDSLRQLSSLFCDMAKKESARHVATKDVYGTGTLRDVLYIDSIGVKKYRRAKGMAAKP